MSLSLRAGSAFGGKALPWKLVQRFFGVDINRLVGVKDPVTYTVPLQALLEVVGMMAQGRYIGGLIKRDR